jgi:hypothetical protein
MHGRMILVLSAYFDDSGTHAASPYVVLGGLLGTEEQWAAFEVEWAKLLASPLPGKTKLSQFHLSPCRAGKGEFRGYSLVERDHITHLFRSIILGIGLVTIAAAVDKKAWDELIVGEIAEQIGGPEELCFVKCVDLVINTIRLRKPSERVVIAFDQGTKAKLEMWARFYLAQSEKYPELAGLGFGKVSEVLPLQGADLIALETYQFSQAWAKNRDEPEYNPHFKDFIKRELSTGLIFEREQIEEIVPRARREQAEIIS